MKHFFILTVSILLSFTSLFAQKIKIDYKTLHPALTILPNNYGVAEFDDYKLVSANRQDFYVKYGMSEEQFLKSLPTLQGYNKVPYGEQFTVEIAIADPVFKKEKINTIKNTVDKKEVITYSKSYEIQLNVSARILNAKGESILSVPASQTGNQTDLMSTSTFNTVAQVENHVRQNLTKMVNDHVSRVSLDRAKRAMEIMNNNIGFQKKKYPLTIYYIDTKKHPDYAACDAQYESIRAILKAFDKNDDVAAYKAALKTPFEFFRDGSQKYNKADEQEVKLANAYIHNAVVLAYLGDFELDIETWAAEAIQLDQLKKADKRYMEFIKRQRAIMNDFNILNSNYEHSSTTMKIRPGATGFGQEEEISEDEEGEESSDSDEPEVDLELAKRFKSKPSDLVIAAALKLNDGRSFDGYLVFADGDQKSACYAGAQFGYIDEKDKMKKFHIKAKDLQSLTFSKRTIIPLEFKPYDMFGVKESPAFAEVIYTDDKITAYHVFFDDGFLMNCAKAYSVFKPAGMEELFAVTSNDILAKKRAKKYFANCNAAVEYIESTRGWYGNKEANIAFAKTYSACGE
jgi:hypothetical protein